MSDQSTPREVRGKLLLAEAVPQEATVHVKVEDTSRADAEASVVAEWISKIPSPLPGGAELPFAIIVPDVDERVRYSIRVHVDLTGSGDVTTGDLISTVACPVLTFGHGDAATVEARKI